jgi:hypothetical protein
MRVPVQETVKIDLTEDFHVEVKTHLTYGDKKAIKACFLRGTRDAGEMGEANTVLLLRSITDWNLQSPDGSKAPISRETIDKMDEETQVNPILAKLDELYKPPDESQKKV